MDSKTARSEAEVVITPAPEVTENSSSQQEQSNPPLVDQVFSLFKTYLSSQLDEQSKQLEGKSKVVKEAAEFKFKGNRKQFELNALLDHIFGQIEVSLNEPQEIRKLVAEGRQLIKRRQKLIKLADRSKDGWLVGQEYESDELASDSEDEKKIRRAKISAEKKRKKFKANCGNASKKFKSASDVQLFRVFKERIIYVRLSAAN
ncbi:hypothetical protein AWC38_SpisGene1427 [Stylophora pistillata]|uniref:Uncharacterized protein n=1 Tax=Stylophora pistillata TaxID=50429 RepID=A0A2B4SY24_STYPI|nr:hypothetical protein AWC38_SpisGene1427 [Stylophora pistillata]